MKRKQTYVRDAGYLYVRIYVMKSRSSSSKPVMKS